VILPCDLQWFRRVGVVRNIGKLNKKQRLNEHFLDSASDTILLGFWNDLSVILVQIWGHVRDCLLNLGVILVYFY
jgi:hypothetical protein